MPSLNVEAPGALAEAPPGGGGGLRLADVVKTFGGVRALAGVSVNVPVGRTTVIVGPNGAGKTTAFNVLTGQIKPDHGHIWLDDRDVTNLRPHQLARLGVARTFQELRLFDELSVADNLRVVTADEAYVVELISRFQLADVASTPTANLSYATQKIVAVARAMAHRPRILLLDEPMSGVDKKSIDALLAVIDSVRSAGLALCVIEHNLDVVQRLNGHVVCMHLGSVYAEGQFAELADRKDIQEIFFGMTGDEQ